MLSKYRACKLSSQSPSPSPSSSPYPGLTAPERKKRAASSTAQPYCTVMAIYDTVSKILLDSAGVGPSTQRCKAPQEHHSSYSCFMLSHFQSCLVFPVLFPSLLSSPILSSLPSLAGRRLSASIFAKPSTKPPTTTASTPAVVAPAVPWAETVLLGLGGVH